MTPHLVRHLAEYEYLREQLQAEYREIDDDALRDTLEGLSSLPEALSAFMRTYLDDLSIAAALGLRIGEMQERLHRIEARAEKKRAIITSVMERADMKKLSEPDFTATLRSVPPGLLVQDEREIPQSFWKPQAPKLDRRAVIAALSAGQAVPGASLGNGSMTLAVRTR